MVHFVTNLIINKMIFKMKTIIYIYLYIFPTMKAKPFVTKKMEVNELFYYLNDKI
jgi:hypothetical protein